MKKKQFTKTEVFSFLKDQRFMTLSTVNEECKSQSAVLAYVVDEDLNLYFATHENTRKAINLMQNRSVSVVVWKLGELSIQLTGEANVLQGDEASAAADLIAETAASVEDFWPPLLRIGEDEFVVYKIKASKVQIMDLSQDFVSEKESPVVVLDL